VSADERVVGGGECMACMWESYELVNAWYCMVCCCTVCTLCSVLYAAVLYVLYCMVLYCM
jgi:hypothetical protein